MQINRKFETIDRAKMTENLKKLDSVETSIPNVNQILPENTNQDVLVETLITKFQNLRDK